MALKLVFSVIVLLSIFEFGTGWKAVPANQAVYALRQGKEKIPDELLPRTSLHSVYKFGWCSPDSTKSVYLRKNISVTFGDYYDTAIRYIYVLDHKHTQRFRLQCVVMKFMVPHKYFLRRSRIPMYYCQGQVYILMRNTIQRLQIHEFYIVSLLAMPVTLKFEFYHATQL